MLIAQLEKLAKEIPEKPAVSHGKKALSYSSLYDSITVFSGQLLKAGIGNGDFVCIVLPNGIDFVVSFFAVAAVKGIAIPMDPSLTDQEIYRYTQGLKLAAIISDRALKIDIDCIHLQPGHLDNSHPADIHSAYSGPVLCQFSSGSTGISKRVLRTQKQLVQEYKQLSQAIKPDGHDAVAVIVPLHHAHGFGNAMLFSICNGLRLVIPEIPTADDGKELPFRFWRNDFLRFLVSERITILPAVPFIFSLLASASQSPENSCLRLCISAGSPLDEDTYRLFRERFGISIRQLYGCTEAGSVTLNTSENIDNTRESVGKPLPGVKLKLEGEDNLVAFRSDAMADGYLDEIQKNNQSFQNGWFLPGDMGHLDEDGNLYILGRRRPFIISCGYKIDPLEIEQVLCNHQHVSEAVVFGVPHASVGEIIKAVVIPHQGNTIDKNDLLKLCASQLAGFKQPRLLEVRESLPRSPLGKILLKELI